MPQKKCDWIGCSEIGFFDGLDKKLLTDQAKKHILPFLKLIFLCPYHEKNQEPRLLSFPHTRNNSSPE